ncbi:hypothetical protein N0M98_09480 [Paenibacillus doosanensis]|uniref:hypothetical protein n=1 Tax=Paenibacillus doosanensis TaxID=1229154 RepID=UPI00217F7954|nr:hypothetical protein [Paenibacillus doosanensis]MCS7460372.1 hypothetical protein [Paenibacillus doosanensis]
MRHKFTLNNENFMIPSRFYPIADLKNIRIFHKDNTIDSVINNEELASELNKHNFETGQCYSNAVKVCEIGRKLGVNIEFWVGWVEVSKGLVPIHHAWNVYDGHIIDVSISYHDAIVIKQTEEAIQKMEQKKNMRFMARTEMYAAMLRKMEPKRPPTIIDRVFGAILDEKTYIGSPDTIDNAVNTWTSIMERFPQHPTIKEMATGETRLQAALRK